MMLRSGLRKAISTAYSLVVSGCVSDKHEVVVQFHVRRSNRVSGRIEASTASARWTGRVPHRQEEWEFGDAHPTGDASFDDKYRGGARLRTARCADRRLRATRTRPRSCALSAACVLRQDLKPKRPNPRRRREPRDRKAEPRERRAGRLSSFAVDTAAETRMPGTRGPPPPRWPA